MDRVRFHVRDAAAPGPTGPYDLVVAFECIYDMSRPVEALGAMRKLVAEEGSVLVMDERVAESFTAPRRRRRVHPVRRPAPAAGARTIRRPAGTEPPASSR